MANKHDLKTVFRSLTAGTSGSVYIVTNDISTTSAVPAGKTRFLTYLRIQRSGIISIPSAVTGLSGVVASLAIASNVTSYASAVSGGAKMMAGLAAMDNDVIGASGNYVPEPIAVAEYPEEPDMNNPILSVAGGSCMVYYCASGPTARLFAQYYDE